MIPTNSRSSRRRLLLAIVVGGLVLPAASPAQILPWPTRPVGNTPEEFTTLIEADTAERRRLAARLGIKAE